MKKKRYGMVTAVLMILLFGTIAANGTCFPVDPNYTDDSGDQESDPSFCDILEVWVGHDGTYLQFLMNFAAPWNYSTGSTYQVFAYISIDNGTGYDWAGDGFLYENRITWRPSGYMSFWDDNNTNNLYSTVPKQMSYYNYHNNNYTVEFGYRLRTYYNDAGADKGYLNISKGQTIYIKFYAGEQTSDWAPNETDPAIGWNVTGGPGGGIPGFEWLFLGITLSTVVALYLMDRRRLKI